MWARLLRWFEGDTGVAPTDDERRALKPGRQWVLKADGFLSLSSAPVIILEVEAHHVWYYIHEDLPNCREHINGFVHRFKPASRLEQP